MFGSGILSVEVEGAKERGEWAGAMCGLGMCVRGIGDWRCTRPGRASLGRVREATRMLCAWGMALGLGGAIFCGCLEGRGDRFSRSANEMAIRWDFWRGDAGKTALYG